MGRSFWAPLLTLLDAMAAAGTIDPADRLRLVVTDSAEEAVHAITGLAIPRFGLTYGPRVRHWPLLGERA
jgi:predicted Rossmann-fold nucleotide-binding protein